MAVQNNDSKIFSIFNAIHEKGIRYCHFKSNANLDVSFAGDTDFDLLVDKKSISALKELLIQTGFKQRYATFDKSYVFMEDFLFYDEALDRIHHFHLHYDLLFGKKLRKNIFLKMDFKNFIVKDKKFPIYILKPELELVLLVLRLIFKLDVFKVRYVLVNRKVKLEKSIKRELDVLLKDIDKTAFNDILKTYFPKIQQYIFQYIDYYVNKNLAQINVSKLQYMIKNSSDKSLLFVEGKRYEDLYKIKKQSKKTSTTWIESGGITISIVGVDGSGKSTGVSELNKFLSYKLTTEVLYLGKVETFITKKLRSLSRRFRQLHIRYLESAFRGLQQIYIANKKVEIFKKSQSNNKLGLITIIDRFPLKEFYTMPDPMDGPKLTNKDLPYFREKEKELFSQIDDYPDLLIVLDIDLDTSLNRKPEHRKIKSRIIEKVAALKDFIKYKPSNDNIIIIDATQPQDLVLKQIKKFVWDNL